MRDDGCPDCRSLTSGDCGKHGSIYAVAPCPTCAVLREALEKITKELAEEHRSSREDPAEQRAERYAMEAYELAGKLIAVEAALKEAREALGKMIVTSNHNAAVAVSESERANRLDASLASSAEGARQIAQFAQHKWMCAAINQSMRPKCDYCCSTGYVPSDDDDVFGQDKCPVCGHVESTPGPCTCGLAEAIIAIGTKP